MRRSTAVLALPLLALVQIRASGPDAEPGVEGPRPAAELRAPRPGRAPYAVRLPPLPSGEELPPVPETSRRTANYAIEARLDEASHRIEGRLILDWRNDTDRARRRFPFHLYWNAFRDELSTHARELARDGVEAGDPRERGWTRIEALRLVEPVAADLTATLRELHPDGNRGDATLVEVETPEPIEPGARARFEIEWRSLIPHGGGERAGWVHDYHIVAQWFPKLAGIWRGEWNLRPFHGYSEFFSDFGVYDVRLTLPEEMVVGATGRLEEEVANGDGTRTLRFVQEDVHDFAWAASRRFQVREGRFDEPGYPPVALRLLVQPEHVHLANRYLEAVRVGLRSLGSWAFPYPYRQLTIVDPAWGSGSGGMEYPTLITGGTSRWAPPALQSPEAVTLHEVAHQFWYGLVATNEFDEAWLDEGMAEYHTIKAALIAYGPEGWGRRYFGLPGSGRGGWPVVAPGVQLGRGAAALDALRAHGGRDVMARRSWEYAGGASYAVNSYSKPALVLQTLEGLVGDETMTRFLRTWARRYAFRHPGAEEFAATFSEVAGADWSWFFEETWYSSAECDYAVRVSERAAPGGEGVLTEVTVERRGGARLPVELLVEFSDGRALRESWDGRERWRRFSYDVPLERAVVDPDGVIALDVRPANNSWARDRGQARRAAAKWAARWLFWLQNLLETHTVLG